jgi:hypothetical protein
VGYLKATAPAGAPRGRSFDRLPSTGSGRWFDKLATNGKKTFVVGDQ